MIDKYGNVTDQEFLDAVKELGKRAVSLLKSRSNTARDIRYLAFVIADSISFELQMAASVETCEQRHREIIAKRDLT